MKNYSQDYPTQITFRKRAMDYYIHNIFFWIYLSDKIKRIGVSAHSCLFTMEHCVRLNYGVYKCRKNSRTLDDNTGKFVTSSQHKYTHFQRKNPNFPYAFPFNCDEIAQDGAALETNILNEDSFQFFFTFFIVNIS